MGKNHASQYANFGSLRIVDAINKAFMSLDTIMENL